MIVIYDDITREMRKYKDRRAALAFAIKMNERSYHHPAVLFFQFSETRSQGRYIGRLAREFGTNDFYIEGGNDG